MIEEWGSGYKRVIDACRAGGYPEPEWKELGSALRVVFYPHPDAAKGTWSYEPVNEPVNERQQWLLAQLADGKRFNVDNISTHWKTSESTAKHDIADLKKRGLIEFTGASKTGYYRLKR